MGIAKKSFSKCGTCYLLNGENLRYEVLISSSSSDVFLPTVALFTVYCELWAAKCCSITESTCVFSTLHAAIDIPHNR